MKKKFITFVLGICLIIPCMLMVTACGKKDKDPEVPVMETWDGTATTVSEANNNVITIETAEEFAGFAAAVNAGNTYEGVTIELTCDMDLLSKEWTPIGFGSSDKTTEESENGYVFKGTFDGKGYTLHNLKITTFKDGSSESETASSGVALFGNNLGVIKNVKIDGAEVSGNHYVAALVGFNRAGTVENCEVKDAVVSSLYANEDDTGDKAAVLVAYATSSAKTNKGSVIKNNVIKNSSVNAVRDAGQVIGCIDLSSTYENNTVSNVEVKVNTSSDAYSYAKKGENIKEEVYGRLDKQLARSWKGVVGTLPAEVEGVITISTGEELAAVANAVNGGNTFEGKTIKLACDLDLGNTEWKPIGYGVTDSVTEVVTGAVFMGTFDGQGHTIYNLKQVNTGNMRQGTGFFGNILRAEIKNINIDVANIKGYHWVGTLVGISRASVIDNCHIENASVACVYDNIAEDNGDKAGALVGYAAFSRKPDAQTDSVIKNCSVKDSTVNAVRDAGQMIGCADSGAVKAMENNTATNVIVTANDSATGTGEESKKGQNVRNEIYGRFDAAAKLNWREYGATPEEAIGTLPTPTQEVIDSVTWDVYEIENPAQLAALAKAVNEGNEFATSKFLLTQDIDLGGWEWTPIGYGSSNRRTSAISGYAFKGTFDGQGNVIYNLKLTTFKGEYAGVGLFGNVLGATIKNITIHNATVTGYHYVGTLVGFCRASKIDNCHVIDSNVSCVYDSTSGEEGDKAGVLIGYASHSIDIYEQLGKDSEEDIITASSVITNNSVVNSNVNAVRDAGQMIGCIDSTSDDYLDGNTATNVNVSANNTAEGVEDYDNQGTNISNEIVGRYDTEAITD